MAPKHPAPSDNIDKVSKKAKATPKTHMSSAGEPEEQILATIPQVDKIETRAKPAHEQELMSRSFARITCPIDPSCIQSLVTRYHLGYARPFNQRLPTIRYYTLNVTNFRNAISRVVTAYLSYKLYESNFLPNSKVDAEVKQVVPNITNACMAALYAKLRTIHTQCQTYVTRFDTRPTWAKEMELPLPLAEAIDNLGVFTPSNVVNHVICVPVYPEGTQNEGRSVQVWPSYEYEAYIPIMKQLGIPMKSINTRRKNGSPWWTYKVSYTHQSFKFRCIYPPANYTEHSALIATMFANTNEEGEVLPIITHLDTDQDYAYRLKEIPEDYHVQAFAALCHAPSKEWSL